MRGAWWMLGVVAAVGLGSSEARAEPSPWVLDASVGALRVKSFDDLRFAGDLTAGYATRSFGIVASGFYSGYNLDDNVALRDYLRTGGNAEAWFALGNPSSTVNFHLKATGGGYLYHSDTVFVNVVAPVTGEDSVFGRGALLAGLRVRPSEKFLLTVDLGGGGQYENFTAETFASGANTTSGKAEARLIDNSTFSFRADGRLYLRWTFLDDWLGLRVKAWGQTFTISQVNSDKLLSAAGNQIKEETRELRQIEFSTRAYLDVVGLTFAEIVPAAFGGIDLVRTSGGAANTSVTLPILGVGLVKVVD